MSAQPVSYDHAIELATQERYDEALAVIDALARQRPEVVDYEALRARLLFDKGEPEQALAALDAALARLPELSLHPAHRWASRGVLAHRYGMLLMNQQRFAEALPWLQEAARRNGLATGEWSAQLHAGLAHYRLGQFAEAGRYWYDLLYRAPDLGAHDILSLAAAHVQAAEADGQRAEPMLRLCLARIGLDNADLLEMSEEQGDALAAQQAQMVLAENPDHPHARRILAPLRLRAGDLAGAREDLAVYQRQVPDPKAQVRELEWRHQGGEAEPWRDFVLTEAATDAHGYYLAGLALADFIERVPASADALRPQLLRAWQTGLARFEQYFATGEGGYDDADPHSYSLLCDRLARRLDLDDPAQRDERIALHEKGIAVSDFIEHWLDLLACHDAAGGHQRVVEIAGEVLNRYPLDRHAGHVTWVFSRLIHAWKAIGGTEAIAAARAAIAHMEARLDALPVEERSEAALSMAHARTHFATLLANAAGSMEARERALALDEIEALQARAVVVEDAWVYDAFGRIWRGLGDNERALPLFERAIALTEGDAEDQAAARLQRGLIRLDAQQYAEALTDFHAAFAVRDDWEADVHLHAAQAALGLARREEARALFLQARARGAAQGRTRALYAKVENALKATRPAWKLWGV